MYTQMYTYKVINYKTWIECKSELKFKKSRKEEKENYYRLGK